MLEDFRTGGWRCHGIAYSLDTGRLMGDPFDPNYKKDGELPSYWAIVALLIGVMSDPKLDFKEALGEIEIEPNKVRGTAANSIWRQ